MRNTIRLLILLTFASIMTLLSSCGNTKCPAVQTMESGTYSITVDFSDESDGSYLITVAQKDGVVYFNASSSTVAVFSKDGCWDIDTEQKTYTEFYDGTDANYNTMFVGKNTLKYLDTQTEDSYTVYRYQRSKNGEVQFVYNADNEFCEIREIITVDGKIWANSTLPVVAFSDTVPDEAIFAIPDGYVKAEPEE